MSGSRVGGVVAALWVLAQAVPSRAGTVFVATNGVDSPTCGARKTPCRSISHAINTIAADGDAVVVGPGAYGDLNGNGILGDSTGEETGGRGCMLAIGRDVMLSSSDGAAATIVDAHLDATSCNVGVFADGAQVGKPGKGFTITSTDLTHATGVLVNARNVTVRGNQLVGSAPFLGNTGITATTGDQTVLIEANQVIGWSEGINVDGTNKTVRGNQVSQNQNGIVAFGASSVTGNVVTGGSTVSGAAAILRDAVSLFGNGIYGNLGNGIALDSPFSGAIQKNDVFGNGGCGLTDTDTPAVVAADNYWGAATGPGPDPADRICNTAAGDLVTMPFATKPFKVKAPIKP